MVRGRLRISFRLWLGWRRMRRLSGQTVKGNRHDSDRKTVVDGDERGYDVMAASRRMAQSAERVALRRIESSVDRRSMLEALGY